MAIIDVTVVPKDNERTAFTGAMQLNDVQQNLTVTNTITVTVTGSVLYRKRGLNASGQFEYWNTGVLENGPPSGNLLVEITTIDQFSL